ncbi:hypothetical protein M9H77_16285 [Catharanthus roseus]|uniref:Uncharacterized protein n=1 Tax=Catharanthus roseus TaxID=4058 RepID=A0ACC0B1C3_CATRO|nr:hypothetical protein M9H77_16285 [Catharanthus roseus]
MPLGITVRILRSHCLRIFNILCIQTIPNKYILKRWTKDIELSLGSSGVGDVGKVGKKDIAGYSAWRREILRKFSDLIFASELKINARECIEEGFSMMKDKVASKVGPYYIDNSENGVGSSNFKDPVRWYAKGEHNIRKMSIIVRKCNQTRRKKKSALTHASRIKMAVQLSMNNEVLGRDVNFRSSKCEIRLGTSNYSNVEHLDVAFRFAMFTAPSTMSAVSKSAYKKSWVDESQVIQDENTVSQATQDKNDNSIWDIVRLTDDDDDDTLWQYGIEFERQEPATQGNVQQSSRADTDETLTLVEKTHKGTENVNVQQTSRATTVKDL